MRDTTRFGCRPSQRDVRNRSALAIAFVALTIGCPLSAQVECRARPGTPSLNHVVIAVHNLDSAGARFASAGFTLKPGRLHPDNLLNRHVKFRDQTELELITV